MGKQARANNKLKQAERLGMFKQAYDHYEEKNVGKNVYVKMYNGNTGNWQVAQYSKKSFAAYKAFSEAQKTHKELDEEFNSKIREIPEIPEDM